ncbi:hypothetical protein CASFOL_011187 [Castilleja foliolosa]|uniref:Uncharacterized protein n=1 Tax=Castilleja foliolosa TaxID=1961234 RepID=A0ABD3DWR6_9LAMI
MDMIPLLKSLPVENLLPVALAVAIGARISNFYDSFLGDISQHNALQYGSNVTDDIFNEFLNSGVPEDHNFGADFLASYPDIGATGELEKSVAATGTSANFGTAYRRFFRLGCLYHLTSLSTTSPHRTPQKEYMTRASDILPMNTIGRLSCPPCIPLWIGSGLFVVHIG